MDNDNLGLNFKDRLLHQKDFLISPPNFTIRSHLFLHKNRTSFEEDFRAIGWYFIPVLSIVMVSNFIHYCFKADSRIERSIMNLLGLAYGLFLLSHPLLRRLLPSQLPMQWMSQLFIPPIILRSAYILDWFALSRNLYSVFIMVVPGIAITVASCYVVFKYVFSLEDSMAFSLACLLNSQSGFTVHMILPGRGIPQDVSSLLEAEALFKSSILYNVFHVAYSEFFDPFAVIHKNVLHTLIATTIFTWFVAQAVSFWIRFDFSRTFHPAIIVIAVSYMQYFICNTLLTFSGHYAITLFGLILNINKLRYDVEVEAFIRKSMRLMSNISMNYLYFVLGDKLAPYIFNAHDWLDIPFVAMLYLVTLSVRALSLTILFPLYCGGRWDWQFCIVHMMSYILSGVNMIISWVYIEGNGFPFSGRPIKFIVYVGLVTFVAVFLNPFIVDKFLPMIGITVLTVAQQESLRATLVRIKMFSRQSIDVHKRDELLGIAEWGWIEKKFNLSKRLPVYQNMESVKSLIHPSTVQCLTCKANVTIEPSDYEMAAMTRATVHRLLKTFNVTIEHLQADNLIPRESYKVLSTVVKKAMNKNEYLNVQEVDPFKKSTRLLIHIIKFLRKVNRLFSHSKADGSGTISKLDDNKAFNAFMIKVTNSLHFKVFAIFSALSLGIFFTSLDKLFIKRNIIHFHKFELILIKIILNAQLAALISEILIKLLALGPIKYFHFAWNLLDILTMAAHLAEIFLNDERVQLVMLALYSLRSLRLVQLVVSFLLSKLKDQLQETIYIKFGIGFGFFVAEEEVFKHRELMSSYRPINEKLGRLVAISRLYILKELSEIQALNPEAFAASKTRLATLFVLRDVIRSIKKFQRQGVVEDFHLAQLNRLYKNWIKGLTPKSLQTPFPETPFSLHKIPWLDNYTLKVVFMPHHSKVNFHAGEVIQTIGAIPDRIRIITFGIVRVSGEIVRYSNGLLPNADSFNFYEDRKFCLDFVSAGHTLGLVGLLTRSQCLTKSTAETDVRCIEISYNSIKESLDKIDHRKKEIWYSIWKYVAISISMLFLARQPHYRMWSLNRLQFHMTRALVPNLDSVRHFSVSQLIEDIVLVQGRVKDLDSGTMYVAPCYIPRHVSALRLLGNERSRARPILLVLAAENYKLPEDMRWIGASHPRSYFYYDVMEFDSTTTTTAT